MRTTILTAGIFGLLFSLQTANAADVERGASRYKLCASCHGFKGEGNKLVNAPSLAGQESWYLERQIRNFRDGVRGTAAEDVNGKAMAQMTAGIDSDEEIADIVAYIGKLPIPAPAPTLAGDAAGGKALYTACAACHGQNAEGNATLNAPALAGTDDWYQLAQLQKFKTGMRGTDSRDTYGQQMAPMAAVLADKDAMKNVIAYINSLQ